MEIIENSDNLPVKIDTIEKAMGISEKRMRMIESIVRFELRPTCKKVGDLLYAVAMCDEFTEMEKVYTAYKVSEFNSRKGWFKKWRLEERKECLLKKMQ